MRHLFPIPVVLLTLALVVVLAPANPLSQIREAANHTRDQAEAKSEEVAEQAQKPQAERAAADGAEGAWVLYHAVAVMNPTRGHSAQGVVRFSSDKRGLTITAQITGLTPDQKVSVHIHEFGDLSDPAGHATGGPYDPDGQPSAGDLGHLVADAEGHATFTQTFKHLTLSRAEHNPVLGRGVVIHALHDHSGQPNGNAGARLAQGVIGVAAPH